MVVEVCDGGTQHAAVVHSEDHDGALQCRISMQWRLAVRWMIAMDDHKRGLHQGPAIGYHSNDGGMQRSQWRIMAVVTDGCNGGSCNGWSWWMIAMANHDK